MLNELCKVEESSLEKAAWIMQGGQYYFDTAKFLGKICSEVIFGINYIDEKEMHTIVRQICILTTLA
jgi:hypothetical protein